MHRTLKMYVNIFKTAMDVRIMYVYINVRLTVDKGFYFAIQEILQVESVIFTWRSRGVLNDTIWRIFCQFLLFGDYE